MPAIRQYLTRLSLILMTLIYAPAALADLPTENVKGDPGMLTIWVSGDLEPAWRAFKMAALLFGGDGPFVYGVIKVGLLLACLLAAVYIMSSGNISPLRNFMTVCIFAVLMLPKTTVYIANYMDKDGLQNAGAVRFKQVDGVPFGVAALLGLFSNLSYHTANAVDTAAQYIPDVNWTGAGGFDSVAAGGLPLYGTQGVFSPLKTLMGLRRVFAQGGNPILTTNMATASRDCKTWNKRWNETANGGYLNVITQGLQSGETKVWLESGADDGKVVQASMNCADAGKVIAAQSLAMTTPKPGQAVSPVAEKLQVGQSGDSGKTVQNGGAGAAIQAELNALPSAVASISGSVGGNENPHSILKFAYERVMANGGHLNPNEMARFFSAGVAVDAASVQSALILNRIAQRCIGGADPTCERAELIMGEALSSSAVDAAGEASGWQSTFQKFMNFMLSFYIMITPLMIFVVIVRGVKSFVILGTYITLAAWMYLLLPVQTIAGHFLQYAISDEIYNMLSEAVLSQKPLAALSPQFTERVFDELQKTVLTGSNIMTGVSSLALLVLIGSPYVFSRLAERATMVGQNSINERTEVPRLDESSVIDAAQTISRSSGGQAMERPGQLMSQSESAFTGKLDLSVSNAVQKQAVTAIDSALSKAESNTVMEMMATTDSHGRVTSDGIVWTMGHGGDWKMDYARKGESVLSDSSNQAVAVSVGGNLKVISVNADTRATQTDEVRYVDGNGNTQTFNAATKLDDIKRIETSYGSVDASTLQQARQQVVSDMRSERESLQTATSHTLSNGASASIDQDTFRKLGLLDYAGGYTGPNGSYVYGASDQILEAAKAAGMHSRTVSDAILKAADAPGNVGANLHQQLYGFAANGSENEKLAAYAAHEKFFRTAAENGLTGAAPIADQVASVKTALEYGSSHSVEVQAKIDSDIAAQRADSAGHYGQPIDRSRLDGTAANTADTRSRLDAAQGELSARQTVWEYNHAKIREAAQEANQIQKQINELENPIKIHDRDFRENLPAGLPGTFGQYGVPFGLGTDDYGKNRGKAEETRVEMVRQDEVNRLKEQREAIMQKIKDFDPNNMSRTFDGKPVSEVLGFNPAERFASKSMDLSDQAVPSRNSASSSGPTAAPSSADGHTGMQKAAAMVKRITGERYSNDPDKLIHTPDYIAKRRGIGLCANGTSLVLREAGLIDDRRHGNAQDMGRQLQTHYGWKVVAEGTVTDRQGSIAGYTPRDGQVALISPHGIGKRDGEGGDEHGHIATWVQGVNGGKGAWVSDFYQGDKMVPSPKYVTAGSKITILESPKMQAHFENAASASLSSSNSASSGKVAGSGFAAEIKSLMDKAEGRYDSVNFGKKLGGGSGTRDLSKMTVNEIMAAQKRDEFDAVGRFQMVPETFEDGVKALGLKGSERFTPQLQERFFNDYLIQKAGGGHALGYIQGKHNDLNKAMVAMAKEWAGFPVPYAMKGHVMDVKAGESYYKGYHGNKSRLSVNEVRSALVASRESHRNRK